MIRFVFSESLHVLESFQLLNLVNCFIMVHERAFNIAFISTLFGILGGLVKERCQC